MFACGRLAMHSNVAMNPNMLCLHKVQQGCGRTLLVSLYHSQIDIKVGLIERSIQNACLLTLSSWVARRVRQLFCLIIDMLCLHLEVAALHGVIRLITCMVHA